MKDIECIEDIEQASLLLKQGQILLSVTEEQKKYFLYQNKRIKIISLHSQYSLTVNEFCELFANSTFFAYERSEESVFDFSRDDEYYQWKHK